MAGCSALFRSRTTLPEWRYWYEDVGIVDGVPPFPDVRVAVSDQVLHYVSVDEVHLFVLAVIIVGSNRGELDLIKHGLEALCRIRTPLLGISQAVAVSGRDLLF